MSTEIYYFTGTGNSLYIAKELAEQISDASITSIPKTVDQETITGKGAVGIVCPVYMYNLPHIVIDFIKKLQQPDYFFLVLSGGGETGGCIRATSRLCDSLQLRLSAAFFITMPSNYAPFGATPEETQRENFAAAPKEIERIARMVNDRTGHIEKSNTGLFRSYIHPGIFYKIGHRFLNFMDKDFSADDSCDGCGVCEKVCPVDNISITDGHPEWHSRCQQCYACLQWCPQEAIQYRNKTVGVPRYRNPHVTLKEIVQAS